MTADAEFYFGNLLVADNPDLYLAFAAEWTAEGARVEVTNPTEQSIKATIRSPQAIGGRKPLRAEATVPAGSTVFLDL